MSVEHRLNGGTTDALDDSYRFVHRVYDVAEVRRERFHQDSHAAALGVRRHTREAIGETFDGFRRRNSIDRLTLSRRTEHHHGCVTQIGGEIDQTIEVIPAATASRRRLLLSSASLSEP